MDCEDIVRIARALSVPSRFQVLQLVGAEGSSLAAVAERVGLAPSTVHRHLQVLVGAGLAVRVGQGKSCRYAWSPTRLSFAFHAV